MQYQKGSIGRVFALRLEEGDRLPDTLEAFAREQSIEAAMVI
jgi:predicted DNA-binding protein with PD1-like motif